MRSADALQYAVEYETGCFDVFNVVRRQPGRTALAFAVARASIPLKQPPGRLPAHRGPLGHVDRQDWVKSP